MERTVGNRYSEDEAKRIDMEDLEASYQLEEQENFKGTPEELIEMQYAERKYRHSQPIMTDEEWDLLKKRYNYQESLEVITASGRKSLKLQAPLVSLDKAGNREEFYDYIEKVGEETEKIVELKIDGVCANVVYELNKKGFYQYKTMSSRAPIFGMEYHPAALYGVNSNMPAGFPANLLNLRDENGNFFKTVELRGEAAIPINDYTLDKYMKYDEFEGKMVEPVWRSATNGILTRKVPQNPEGLIYYINEQDKDAFEENTGDWIIPKTLEYSRMFYSLIPDEEKMNIETGKPYRFLKGWDLRINRYSMDIEVYESKESEELVFSYEGSKMQEYLDVIFYSVAINGSNIDLPITSNEPGSFKELSEEGYLLHVSQVPFRDDHLVEKPKGFETTYKITSDTKEIEKSVLEFYGNEEVLDEKGKLQWKRNPELPRLRNMYVYSMDGVTIKPVGSNMETQGLKKKIGRMGKMTVPKYPNDQVAVKLYSESVFVKIDRIERSETKLKNVTASGILDRPYRTESGAYVSNINLFNDEWLSERPWIQEAADNGTELEMIMSLDIIPTLIKPMGYESEK